MRDNDHFVPPVDEFARQLVDVALNTSWLRVEEVRDHATDVISTPSPRRVRLLGMVLRNVVGHSGCWSALKARMKLLDHHSISLADHDINNRVSSPSPRTSPATVSLYQLTRRRRPL